MNVNIRKQLHRVIEEDYVWIIYIFIIAFNLYSNHLEKQYITTGDTKARSTFRKINAFVLVVILLIYLYFVYTSFSDYKELSIDSSETKKRLVTLTLIASLLFLIGGAITLYVTIKSPDLDDEIAII